MTRSSRDTKGISFDTVEWLGAGIGAKASVPLIAPLRSSEAAKAISSLSCARFPKANGAAGFPIGGRPMANGLARCGSIELHPFHHRIARAIEKQN